jgi:hypothetical protein
MKIEVLCVPDCPNYLPAVALVQDVLREHGLSEAIDRIEVSSSSQAAAVSFLGSPTVRVNGKDVEPSVLERDSFGVSCRTYFVDGRLQGLPRREWIRDAIVSAGLKK